MGLPDKKPLDAVTEALDRQRAYEARRPTRLGRGAEALTAPLGAVLSKVVPPEWVLRGLEMSDQAAGWTVPKMDHDRDTLEDCQAAALRVQGWAQGLNASSGLAAGLVGGAGLAVDIPATLALAARNVRATGTAYGFDGDDEDERAFRLMVLEVATTMASEAREETMGRLDKAARVLNDPTLRGATDRGTEWVMSKIVDRVARQLGVSLAGRKLGQIVPVVGGAVGAAVNASFQVDVARAARFAYEKRWLMARRLLEAPDD
ncbi:MAG: EcsC family protein [Pseudomonadota bacterium]